MFLVLLFSYRNLVVMSLKSVNVIFAFDSCAYREPGREVTWLRAL